MYIVGGLLSILCYVFTREVCEYFLNNLKINTMPIPERTNHILIGETEKGKKLYHNFNKFHHMIVAGMTGYGKTNFMKTMISQLNGEIYLIDLKGGFDYPKATATDIHHAKDVLLYLSNTMRQKRNKPIYVIVDEAGELVPPSYLTKEEKAPYEICLRIIGEISRIGRGFKMYLIYSTQYPTREIVNGQIKQNCETRICFRLPDTVGSLVALDEQGAEHLPTGKAGVGIYKRDNKTIFRAYQMVEHEGWANNIVEHHQNEFKMEVVE